MDRKRGLDLFGDMVHESGEPKAELLLKTELKKIGWQENELALRHKGNPGKVRLAQHLRANTTMSLAWIAERLQMRVHGHVSHLLH
jgi:hypothetical protein